MWTTQRYVTLFWVVLGAVVIIGSYRVGIGRLLEPGPGLMPFVLGAVLCLLALFKLTKGEKSAANEKPTGLRRGVGRITVIMVALFAYAFLVEPLGYLITTFLAMIFLMKAAGNERWLPILLYSAIISVVSYFGFVYLGTRLPQGVLSFLGV